MNDKPVIVGIVLNAPIEKVWEAITDKGKMKQWYFNIAEFNPEPGFEFSFRAGEEDKEYLHVCKITEVKPGKKLTHSWRFENYEGLSHVTWELFLEAGKTRLKLTHTGIETFPADNPDFAKKNFNEGWNQIIRTSLKNYVEKN